MNSTNFNSETILQREPLKAVSREVLKSVLLVALFILTLSSSILPFALQRAALRSRTARRRQIFVAIFSHLSCFGGGVFLATCLLDLLPDSRDVLADGFEKLHLHKTSFPLAEFLMAFGFFIVLFSEQIFLWCKEYKITNNESDTPNAAVDTGGETRSLLHEEHYRRDRGETPPRPQVVGYLGSIQNQPTVVDHSLVRRSVSSPMGASGRNYGSFLEDSVEIPTPATSSSESVAQDVHFDPESHSTSRAVLLLVALSLHSTFEGLALGLQQDVAIALQIFGALAIHKSILAFSLGLRLVQSKLSTLGVVCCCLVFSMTAAIGGLIGIAIVEVVKSSAAYVVNGTLQGIACGTFLYVTAFEILPHELNDGTYRLSKLIMLTLGFSTICLFLLLWPEEDNNS